MRRDRRKTIPQLSVCCLSSAPLTRTAGILRLFRSVADEIVCAVDARVPEHELEVLHEHVDVLTRCEFDPSTGLERHLMWLFRLCSGRWIFRIDGDEVPSSSLLTALPRLTNDPDLLQYVLPCRWLFPDAGHFIDERPWSEDWHVRLVRNDRVALRVPGELHSNISGVEPHRYIDFPFYHLTCLINSQAERQAKAAHYEAAQPERETLPGWSVNNHYLPERYQRSPSTAVPEQDIQLINTVLGLPNDETLRKRPRRTPPTAIVPLDEIDRSWPLRQVDPSAYQATWTTVPHIGSLRTGETRRIFVGVRNDGTETWPFGDQQPAFRLCYRWRSTDGTGVVGDGIPTRLTCDVRPGETVIQPMWIYAPEEPGDLTLQFCLLHEGVRWFGEGPTQSLPVAADSADAHHKPVENV